MTNYKDASMTICTFGQIQTVDSIKCDVNLNEDGVIEVSYKSKATLRGCTVYDGQENGEGHYLIESEKPVFRGSLHRFPGSMMLEGYWEKEGDQGMWRIELDEVLDAVTGESAYEVFEPEEVGKDPEDDAFDLLLIDEEEVESGDWTSNPRQYTFPMRSDWDVVFTLPDDMNRREGKRLARFVKSISYY